MKEIFKICNKYPEVWDKIVGEIVIKDNRKIGYITEIRKYNNDIKIVINNGQRTLLAKWFEDGKYFLENIKFKEELINKLEKEYKDIYYEINIIATNIKEIDIKLREIINLRNISINSLRKITMGNRTVYKNHCWRCKKDIDSTKDKFCTICGWYICSDCGACSCNSIYKNNITEIYKKIISNNNEAINLIENIKSYEYKMQEQKVVCEFLTERSCEYLNKAKNILSEIDIIKKIS